MPTASPTTPPAAPRPAKKFLANLPAGGQIELKSADEVAEWDRLAAGYIADFGLTRTNELAQLGAILAQQIAQSRAMRDLSDIKKAPGAVAIISKTSEQIGELEKRLGIDRKTLQAGAKDDLGDYLKVAKRFAHEKGIRIADRVKAFEEFNMELRWKLRVLNNADDEDRRHHGITPDGILKWADQKLAEIEAKEQEWASQRGKLYVGRL